MSEINDIPEEVWYVLMCQMKQYVTREMYDKCQEIIKRHPKHFPWEARYYAIHQSVHDAHDKEINKNHKSIGDIIEIPLFDESIPTGDGIINKILEQGISTEEYNIPIKYTLEDNPIINYYNTLREKEIREESQENEWRRVWDKHYKKHNLNYKPKNKRYL